MAKSTLPPRFKPQTAPVAIKKKVSEKTGLYRGSSNARGYDARWRGMALKFRKLNPFCLFCDQDGRDSLTDLVDHMIPVVDRPDMIHDWKNLAPLCKLCHGKKYRLEVYARQHGLIEMLPIWVKQPDKRPEQFKGANWR